MDINTQTFEWNQLVSYTSIKVQSWLYLETHSVTQPGIDFTTRKPLRSNNQEILS